MSLLKKRIERAVSTIVNMATLPPQIDYVSPGDRIKVRDAEALINSLPIGLKMKYSEKIESQIEAYYSPNIEGENGETYSIAELDAMF